jgi:hypothetical protein
MAHVNVGCITRRWTWGLDRSYTPPNFPNAFVHLVGSKIPKAPLKGGRTQKLDFEINYSCQAKPRRAAEIELKLAR